MLQGINTQTFFVAMLFFSEGSDMSFASSFLLLLLAPSLVAAQQAPVSPLVRYTSIQNYSLIACDMAFEGQRLDTELRALGRTPDKPAPDLRACIVAQRAEVLGNLGPALKSLKTPAAKNALKRAHAAFVAALEGIKPGFDERKITYAARQRGLRDALEREMAAVEIEQQ